MRFGIVIHPSSAKKCQDKAFSLPLYHIFCKNKYFFENFSIFFEKSIAFFPKIG